MKTLADYFENDAVEKTVMSVLDVDDVGIEHYTITVKVSGSGLSASQRPRLGIARALVKRSRPSNSLEATRLSANPRSVERAQFGLAKLVVLAG